MVETKANPPRFQTPPSQSMRQGNLSSPFLQRKCNSISSPEDVVAGERVNTKLSPRFQTPAQSLPQRNLSPFPKKKLNSINPPEGVISDSDVETKPSSRLQTPTQTLRQGNISPFPLSLIHI